jgi:hypothetical protein
VIKIPQWPIKNIKPWHIIETWGEEEGKGIQPLKRLTEHPFENRHPVANSSRMKIRMFKGSNEIYKGAAQKGAQKNELLEKHMREIQDGNWDTAADHMSFMNQGLC